MSSGAAEAQLHPAGERSLLNTLETHGKLFEELKAGQRALLERQTRLEALFYTERSEPRRATSPKSSAAAPELDEGAEAAEDRRRGSDSWFTMDAIYMYSDEGSEPDSRTAATVANVRGRSAERANSSAKARAALHEEERVDAAATRLFREGRIEAAVVAAERALEEAEEVFHGPLLNALVVQQLQGAREQLRTAPEARSAAHALSIVMRVDGNSPVAENAVNKAKMKLRDVVAFRCRSESGPDNRTAWLAAVVEAFGGGPLDKDLMSQLGLAYRKVMELEVVSQRFASNTELTDAWRPGGPRPRKKKGTQDRGGPMWIKEPHGPPKKSPGHVDALWALLVLKALR